MPMRMLLMDEKMREREVGARGSFQSESLRSANEI